MYTHRYMCVCVCYLHTRADETVTTKLLTTYTTYPRPDTLFPAQSTTNSSTLYSPRSLFNIFTAVRACSNADGLSIGRRALITIAVLVDVSILVRLLPFEYNIFYSVKVTRCTTVIDFFCFVLFFK